MTLAPPLIPDNAPFTPGQRAWLNGFFAGLLNLDQLPGGGRLSLADSAAALAGMAKEAAAPPPADEFEAPWHDPALDLPERMKLAEGKPLPQRLMAAMGQLDCGQCGHDCKAYALKLADGSETKSNLCVPGGRATQKMLKELLAEAPGTPSVAPPPTVGRANPVTAMLTAAAPLNASGSAKDTRHVVIDVTGTPLTYEAGDSLGVYATNDPALVDAIVETLGADPMAEVGDGNGHGRGLRQALLEDRDLRQPGEALFGLLAETADNPDEARMLAQLARGEGPQAEIEELDLLEVLERFPSARPSPKPFVEALDELQPRLYSIASSPRAHAGEVHLTVGIVAETVRGRLRRGVASNHFARLNGHPQPLRVYRQPSHGFALPADDTRPVVMIGPGTGIAPFRAFLHERKARGATGPNWLFFGNPRAELDFLYREELAALQADGVLTRLDTAFSRDQADKVYVQHRILQASAELWRWLQDGAHLYVCGDAKRMAADVDRALREVVVRHGALDETGARAWLADLAKAGRYQRDVY